MAGMTLMPAALQLSPALHDDRRSSSGATAVLAAREDPPRLSM
jgi:hypothetical protein